MRIAVTIAWSTCCGFQWRRRWARGVLPSSGPPAAVRRASSSDLNNSSSLNIGHRSRGASHCCECCAVLQCNVIMTLRTNEPFIKYYQIMPPDFLLRLFLLLKPCFRLDAYRMLSEVTVVLAPAARRASVRARAVLLLSRRHISDSQVTSPMPIGSLCLYPPRSASCCALVIYTGSRIVYNQLLLYSYCKFNNARNEVGLYYTSNVPLSSKIQ